MAKEDVTKLYLDPRGLEKWIYQNKAEYMGNFCEGVLLDSFMLATKRGYAGVYEHYLNPWNSDYYIEFQKGDAPTVWDNWTRFEDKYIEEYGGEE